LKFQPNPIEGLGGRWKFDFSLNHVAKETLIKTISTVGKNLIVGLTEKATFEIEDIKKLRSDAAAVVIGDDHRKRARDSLGVQMSCASSRNMVCRFTASSAIMTAWWDLAQRYSTKGT
jgi:hypothetical protein